MEIKEVISGVKKTLGNNEFLILAGCLLLFGIYNYVRQSKEEQSEAVQMETPVGYTSYPDAVTNANVIISTLQDSLDYDQIEDMERFDSLEEMLSDNFTATNDYINEGFDSMKKMDKINHQEIMGSLGTLGTNVSSIKTDVSGIKSDVSGIKTDVSGIKTDVSGIKTDVSGIKDKTNNIYDKINTPPPSNDGGGGGGGGGGGSNNFSATPYGGVSIVDGLKAIGEYGASSYSERKKIAAANGIRNYRGTAAQNTQMLNMLKSGNLKRA